MLIARAVSKMVMAYLPIDPKHYEALLSLSRLITGGLEQGVIHLP